MQRDTCPELPASQRGDSSEASGFLMGSLQFILIYQHGWPWAGHLPFLCSVECFEQESLEFFFFRSDVISEKVCVKALNSAFVQLITLSET